MRAVLAMVGLCVCALRVPAHAALSPAPAVLPTAPRPTRIDPWFRDGPDELGPWSWPRLTAAQVLPITGAKLSRAMHLLRRRPVVPLSRGQASAFAARQVAAPRGDAPYLVRALYFIEPGRHFRVYRKGRRVWVTNVCATPPGFGMKRYALVVLLPVRPSRVYVMAVPYR